MFRATMCSSYNCPPEDEHTVSLKHVEDPNKHIIEEIVREVGYLPELYEYTCTRSKAY
jgi:hypothetical protein